MVIREVIFKELIKNGYSKSNGKKIWDIANRSLLNLTPEQAKAFLKLKNFKPYKKNVFDREVKLIKDNIGKFIEKIGTNKQFNLIDIGCGDGTKAKEFIRALRNKVKIRYCPISPDEYLINVAINNIKKGKFKNTIEYKPCKADFESLDKVASLMRSKKFQKNVILLHGSILASYEINDYLFKLSTDMLKGDYIIIGNGIRKGERLVNLDLYKNKIFGNLFSPLMKSLGFKKNEIEQDARFGKMRVEGFFKIKVYKKVIHKGKVIEFNKGDEIIVAILYKYYLEELENFFKMYFSEVNIVKDSEDEYILALCKK